MGSVVKGLFGGSGAAGEAAGVQAAALGQGIEEQRRQFGVTQEQLSPFREAGLGALEQQQALLGLGGQEAQQSAFAAFKQSPGQQFLQERQQKALLRNQAAIGGLGGGNVRTALQQQAVGFGQQDIQNQLARLAGLSSRRQQAAMGLGQFGQAQAGNVANLLEQQGQARAGGILGAQQARAGTAQNIIGLGASLFSDENMKHDVYDMSPEECMKTVLSLDIKAWRYLPEFDLGEEMHIGPMSQTAPECIKVEGKEMLDLHSELMLIAGALQYLKEKGMIQCH